MGYRAEIETMNAIGHLVEGNIISFLELCFSSDEMYYSCIDALRRTIQKHDEMIFTSSDIQRVIPELKEHLARFIEKLKVFKGLVSREYRPNANDAIEHIFYLFEEDNFVLDYLKKFSKFLSRCRIKTILLPGVNDHKKQNESHANIDMTSQRLFHDIVRINPEDSVLILQFKSENGLNEDEVVLLNVFSRFETALRHIDSWPGVLLWDDDDSLLVPVRNEEETIDVYRCLKYEQNGLRYLKSRMIRKKPNKYACLFHLSDLHFGKKNKVAERRRSRMETILQLESEKMFDCSLIQPIITGDQLHSPKKCARESYDTFEAGLLGLGFQEPIVVLGNHDIAYKGNRLYSKTPKVVADWDRPNAVQLIKSINLAVICFNSTIGGIFSQGQIGEEQMMRVGNEIDHIVNREEYTFIAILHHHLLAMPQPSWKATGFWQSLGIQRIKNHYLRLNDADIFLQWLQRRNIKYVLHGHKHVPFFQNSKGINVIAAGSTSGNVNHVEAGKTCMSYNVIKYDIDEKRPVSCTFVAETIAGAGTRNVMITLY